MQSRGPEKKGEGETLPVLEVDYEPGGFSRHAGKGANGSPDIRGKAIGAYDLVTFGWVGGRSHENVEAEVSEIHCHKGSTRTRSTVRRHGC